MRECASPTGYMYILDNDTTYLAFQQNTYYYIDVYETLRYFAVVKSVSFNFSLILELLTIVKKFSTTVDSNELSKDGQPAT